jgi:hypothetical protein
MAAGSTTEEAASSERSWPRRGQALDALRSPDGFDLTNERGEWCGAVLRQRQAEVAIQLSLRCQLALQQMQLQTDLPPPLARTHVQ